MTFPRSPAQAFGPTPGRCSGQRAAAPPGTRPLPDTSQAPGGGHGQGNRRSCTPPASGPVPVPPALLTPASEAKDQFWLPLRISSSDQGRSHTGVDSAASRGAPFICRRKTVSREAGTAAAQGPPGTHRDRRPRHCPLPRRRHPPPPSAERRHVTRRGPPPAACAAAGRQGAQWRRSGRRGPLGR